MTSPLRQICLDIFGGRFAAARAVFCVILVPYFCTLVSVFMVAHNSIVFQNCPCTCTHTHAFNGPFSGTTWVSWYQNGKTNLDFTEARDNEWQWHQLGHMQVCTSLQTDDYASTPLLSFLQARCPSCSPTNSVKALKATFYLLLENSVTGNLCSSVQAMYVYCCRFAVSCVTLVDSHFCHAHKHCHSTALNI